MILIGTQHDLKEAYDKSERSKKYPSVSKNEGKSLAKKIGAIGYFETSAKTGMGIKEAFDAILLLALKSRREHKRAENNTCFSTKCQFASCLSSCCQLCWCCVVGVVVVVVLLLLLLVLLLLLFNYA